MTRFVKDPYKTTCLEATPADVYGLHCVCGEASEPVYNEGKFICSCACHDQALLPIEPYKLVSERHSQ